MARPKHAERVHPGQPGISQTKGAHVANPRQSKADRVPRHRQDPAVAARIAGDRGRHAEPMGWQRRLWAYEGQNRTARLTPRQQRRAAKKQAQERVRDLIELGVIGP